MIDAIAIGRHALVGDPFHIGSSDSGFSIGARIAADTDERAQ